MNKIFYIAEIGINHNGDLEIAKKLILEAKLAGFDAVKFQKRDIDLVYSKEILDSKRDSPWGTTQRHQKEGLELKKKDYDEIDNFCKSSNIEWFASAWDINSLKFLDNYNLNYHKIASAMIVDEEFVKEVAKRGKYTFISTGMSTMENIKKAVEIFRNHKTPFELMHCCSAYPMKTHDANLLSIGQIKKLFNCKVGYSGHEAGLAVSYAAAMQGISSLERHITLDRSMYGSDQAASIEPRGMRELISVINIMLESLGEMKAGIVLESEKEVAKKLRSHIKLKN
jgi:N-acetylneuraminate synthase